MKPNCANAPKQVSKRHGVPPLFSDALPMWETWRWSIKPSEKGTWDGPKACSFAMFRKRARMIFVDLNGVTFGPKPGAMRWQD